jgi:hypothetical protein
VGDGLMASPYSTGRRGVRFGTSGPISSAQSIKGANDFLKLSKALKAAGKTDLRKELHKAMRDAAKPLIPKVREAARRELPHRGGLSERVAKKPYRAQVLTGAKTGGVRIVGTKVDPRINEGRVWHPVFGRKGKPKKEGGRNSVVQKVPEAAGYFDKTLEQSRSQVRASVISSLNEFAERIARGV